MFFDHIPCSAFCHTLCAFLRPSLVDPSYDWVTFLKVLNEKNTDYVFDSFISINSSTNHHYHQWTVRFCSFFFIPQRLQSPANKNKPPHTLTLTHAMRVPLILLLLLQFLTITLSAAATSHNHDSISSSDRVRANFARVLLRNTMQRQQQQQQQSETSSSSSSSLFSKNNNYNKMDRPATDIDVQYFPPRYTYTGSFLLHFDPSADQQCTEMERIAHDIARERDLEYVGPLPGNEYVHLLRHSDSRRQQHMAHLQRSIEKVDIAVNRDRFPTVLKLEREHVRGYQKR